MELLLALATKLSKIKSAGTLIASRDWFIDGTIDSTPIAPGVNTP
jgi:hypothetical protein